MYDSDASQGSIFPFVGLKNNLRDTDLLWAYDGDFFCYAVRIAIWCRDKKKTSSLLPSSAWLQSFLALSQVSFSKSRLTVWSLRAALYPSPTPQPKPNLPKPQLLLHIWPNSNTGGALSPRAAFLLVSSRWAAYVKGGGGGKKGSLKEFQFLASAWWKAPTGEEFCCPTCLFCSEKSIFALMDVVTSPPLRLLLPFLLLHFNAPPHVWLKLWNNRRPDSGRNAAAAAFCIRASLSQSLRAQQPLGPSLAPSCGASDPTENTKNFLGLVWSSPTHSRLFRKNYTGWTTNVLKTLLLKVQGHKKSLLIIIIVNINTPFFGPLLSGSLYACLVKLKMNICLQNKKLNQANI